MITLKSCEYSEIDRLLAIEEAKLFQFIAEGTKQTAQVVYRCNQFDPRTARCESPLEDNTAHPFSSGISPLTIPDGKQIKFISALPRANLAAVYRVSLADALDGKSATLLSSGTETIAFPSSAKNIALIAIYTTQDTWRYRKAIWYY